MIRTDINRNYKSSIDKTIELYSDLSYLFKLLDDNELTEITGVIEGGQVLSYDDEIVFLERTTVAPSNIVSAPQEKVIRVRENQTLYDLSLQVYGSIAGIFELIAANPQIEFINNTLIKDVQLAYTEQTYSLPRHFKAKNIFIATAWDGTLNRAFDLSFDLSFG